MSILKQHEKKRVIEKLVAIMDGRRGSLLFLGAHLPEVAVHAMGRGLYVTVVESNEERMKAFLEPLKKAGHDLSVSLERRPYEAIEFVASSYNYVICWDGVPAAFPDPALFFKKVRRELRPAAPSSCAPRSARDRQTPSPCCALPGRNCQNRCASK